MSDLNYHADFTHVSKTMLNLFLEDREVYYHTYVKGDLDPKPSTQQMLAGTVLHAMILEDKPFDEMVVCYPPECLKSDGALNPKPAKVFRAEHPGCEFMKAEHYEDIRAVVDAVMTNPKLTEILEQATGREQRHNAVIEGLRCKCKPDLEIIGNREIVLYDLKFPKSIHRRAWKKTSRALNYWLQDAHYSAVVAKKYGIQPTFKFVSCELKMPYRIAVRDYEPISRETARSEHLKHLRELAACHYSGSWAEDLDETFVLEPYDVPGYEDEDAMVEYE